MSSTRLTRNLRGQIFSNIMENKFEANHLKHHLVLAMYTFFKIQFKKERNFIRAAIYKLPNDLRAIGSHQLRLIAPRKKGIPSTCAVGYIADMIPPVRGKEISELGWQDREPLLSETYFNIFEGELEVHAHNYKKLESAMYADMRFYGPNVCNLGETKLSAPQHKRVEKIFALHTQIEEYAKLYNQLKGQGNAVLESANTTKQLLDIWPEVDHYLPVIPGVSRAITVRIEDLNKLLGKT
jgi:hypothetical protein